MVNAMTDTNHIEYLEEALDIEKVLNDYKSSISCLTSLMVYEHSIKKFLNSANSTKFNYLSWQTIDVLDDAAYTCVRVAPKKMKTILEVLCASQRLYQPIARFLVLNNAHKKDFSRLIGYVKSMDEEANAILTIAGN